MFLARRVKFFLGGNRMKKKLGLIFTAAMVTSALSAGVASAAYNSSGDWNLNLSVLQGQLKPTSTTGQTTFQLQEAVHNTLTNTTGLSVDHSYIWINVNGVPVLAVDPPRAMF